MYPCLFVKVLSHDQSINSTFSLAIYFSVGGFAIFFFCEFFRVDQRRLTFERLDLLVSFHLPSKSELQLPDASLLLRSDLFKSYRIILGFDFRAYCCCLIQINSQFIDICQLYRFYLLFQLLLISIQLGIRLIGCLSCNFIQNIIQLISSIPGDCLIALFRLHIRSLYTTPRAHRLTQPIVYFKSADRADFVAFCIGSACRYEL